MLLLRPRFVLALLLALFATAALAQTTINVGPGQPYTTIQSGIDAASNGDTVLVAPGTYTENINFNGKAITVTSSGGPAATTIDGGSKGGTATVLFENGEKNTSVISNLTIRGGGNTIFAGDSDGGVYVRNAYPLIKANIITGNYCHNIDVEFGEATITGNEVSSVLQDIAGVQGASYCTFPSGIHLQGVSAYSDAPTTVVNNVIENNLTGSGINLWAAQGILIANNTIRDNISPDDGSAFFSANSMDTVLFQNLIYNNVSGCGGAIATIPLAEGMGDHDLVIASNTIVGNATTSTTLAGQCTPVAQIYTEYPDAFGPSGHGTYVVNNIIAGATVYPAIQCTSFTGPSEVSQPYFQNNLFYNTAGPVFGSSCVDVSDKYNNLVADPQFVSLTKGDFHLKSTSPAIDVGQNSALGTLLTLTGLNFTTDLDGNPRIQDATGHGCLIDIGAYEYPGSQSVCGTQLTLASSLNPSTFGQTVTFTAQLSSNNGTPTGSVQFTDGSIVLGTQALSTAGTATFATDQLTVGTHTITAAYQPTGNSPATSATLTQVVNGYPTTTQLTSSLNPATAGQSVTFTATLASPNGTPAGSVTFADGATTLAVVPVASGTAAYTTSALNVGSHGITATFSPSGAYAGSSATLTEIINGQPTSTTLAVTPNPATAFGRLTLTSTVTASSGSPSGTVTFNAGGVKLGSAPLNANGQTSLSVAAPLPGTYNITAVYSGDATFNTSTSAPVTETINAAASTTVLTASPNPAYQNQAVTLSATVTGTVGQPPTGNVTFSDGSAALGTGTLSASGIASLSVTTLAPGTHNLTANYQATGPYAGSNSSTVQEVILPGTFGIALSPSAVTVGPGKQGTVQVALNSIGGFSGPLQLGLGAVPSYANATLSPTTVSLANGGSGSATLLLNASTARLEPFNVPGRRRSATVLATFFVLLMPLRSRRRARLTGILSLLLLAVLLTSVTGCGMIRTPFQSAAPGIYRIPVTATDSNHNRQTAMLTLTVTQ